MRGVHTEFVHEFLLSGNDGFEDVHAQSLINELLREVLLPEAVLRRVGQHDAKRYVLKAFEAQITQAEAFSSATLAKQAD